MTLQSMDRLYTQSINDPFIFVVGYCVVGLYKDGPFNLVVEMIFKHRLALISCQQEMSAYQ